MEFIIETILPHIKGQWIPAVLMVMYRVEKFLHNRSIEDQKAREEAEKVERERAKRSIERGIREQVEIIYSKAYEAADRLIHDLHNAGCEEVFSRTVGGEKTQSLVGYLGSYTKELKTHCFKRLDKDLSDYIADDKQYYSGENWEGYAESKPEDIRRIMKTALGKRLGASDMLDSIFEQYLTYEFFLNSFTKLIKMARDNRDYL